MTAWFLLPLSSGEGWSEGVLTAERGGAGGMWSCFGTDSAARPPHPGPLPEGEGEGRLSRGSQKSAWPLERYPASAARNGGAPMAARRLP